MASFKVLPFRVLTRANVPACQQSCSCALRPQQRAASANAAKYKRSDAAGKSKKNKKKKQSTSFNLPDLKLAEQFSLCDAMRYLRAFEVGRSPQSAKYELHIRFKTLKNGPVVRNRMRLPFPVDTSTKVCVICPPNSKQAEDAKSAGAAIVGQEDIFEQIREGKVQFDRCICHVESLPALNKANLGRVLGPKGLMPSQKTGTVVQDVARVVRDMMGGSEYRERTGTVRMAIGQLGFTPNEMQQNIKAFMESIQKDVNLISDRIQKDVHEVVLSSTSGPGFSLNGDFRGPDSPPVSALSTI